MKSRTSASFRELLAALPANVQRQAEAAYAIFAVNPHHPGLRFRKVNDSPAVYSARIGLHYRALATMDGDVIIWFWIGSHAEYDRILDQM